MLPFLVVHGTWVWKIVLAVFVASVPIAVALIRRGIAWREILMQRTALDTHEEGVVRGTLGGGEARTTTQTTREGKLSSQDSRASELWLDTEDGRIPLVGDVHVIAGSRAAASRKGATRSWLAEVVPGDAVIARGRLERTPGNAESGYREGDAVLALRGPEGQPISIAAASPRSAVPRLRVIAMLAVVGLPALIGWKVLLSLGEGWRDTCWDHVVMHTTARVDVSNTHACVLAAAMPRSRLNALDGLREQLERTTYRDETSVHQLFWLAEQTAGCHEAIRMMTDSGQLDDALATARRCGDLRAQHVALVALGRFEEACAIRVPASDDAPALPSPQTLILASRWREAADAADQYAAKLTTRPHTADEKQAYELSAMHFRCVAELMRDRAGDREAAGRLEQLARKELGSPCDSALRYLGRLPVAADGSPRLIETGRIDEDLAWLTGGHVAGWDYEPPERVLALPDDMGSWRASAHAWLAKLHGPALPADATLEDRMRLARWLAVANVLDGKPDAAAASAAEAIAVRARAGDDLSLRYKSRPLDALPALVGLYTPATNLDAAIPTDDKDLEQMWLHDFGHLLLRRGDPIDRCYFGPDGELSRALGLAQHGDGVALAQVVGGDHLSWWRDSDVLAVLPRITKGRDAVARQLVWATPSAIGDLEFNFPFGVALVAFARREALAMAGATAEAARWDAVYRRFDVALSDKDRLAALLMWNL